jgi:hypothetical protein
VNNYFAIIGPGVGANKLADGTQDCGADVLAKANNAPGGTIKGTESDGNGGTKSASATASSRPCSR